MFSSQLMNEPYQRILPDYETYRRRIVASVEPDEAKAGLVRSVADE